ncbi:hypothetical protein [Paraconexibacter sp.]|uniref:hypothetical protein n=1 Tax=Paraconexibacter sp. TaxID=2949640 RepID=UPI003566DF91
MSDALPQVQITSPSATPEEAAAVVAAIQQFLRDHAPVIVAEEPALPGWKRAALLEGVGLRSDAEHPWL